VALFGEYEVKRLGVFVDVSNLYYTTTHKFKKKLDYQKLLEYIKDIGDVQQAVAHGAQLSDEAEQFIGCLQNLGFTTKWKRVKTFKGTGGRKADCDIDIAIDVVRMLAHLDMVILCTADGDFQALVSWVQEQGVDVVVIGCNISYALKNVAAKCIEIPESFLETS
jgi:uncharacterized protein (TIGR00288 family)